MHVNNINFFKKKHAEKGYRDPQCMVYSEQAGSGRLCDEVSSGQGPEQSSGVSHMTLGVIGPLTALGHSV